MDGANRRAHGHARARRTGVARGRSRHRPRLGKPRQDARPGRTSPHEKIQDRSHVASQVPSIQRRWPHSLSWSGRRGASVSCWRPWGGSNLDCHLGMRAGVGQAKANYLTGSCGANTGCPQLPPEKCAAKACANPPKPPRVTPLEPGSTEVPDDERLDEASPLKKLLRDDDPPEPPRLPPEEDPCGGHSAPDCGNDGAAIPAPFGSQFAPGISANAPPPTANVPIKRSATCPERLTGRATGVGTAGLRLPNSRLGLLSMISRSSRRH